MIWLPLLWYLILFFGPLVLIFVVSFLARGTYGGLIWSFRFENFLRLLDYHYFIIISQSALLALVTTGICFLFALPLTWKIASMQTRKRNIFLFLVSLPFFMNSIVRIYSIKLWFQLDGPIDQLLTSLSVPHDILTWSQNWGLVIFGMVASYMPFMIFPIYAAFEKLDFSMVEAAQDLGAKPFQILYKVLIPLLKRPILNGCLLVFIPSLGEFLIPDLLGGAKTMLIGNLITELFLKSRDWPQGAALTIALVAVLCLANFLVEKFTLKDSNR